MKIFFLISAFALLSSVGICQQVLDGFSATDAEKQDELEQLFLESVNFSSFRHHLQTITEHPHIAGTPANDAVGEYLLEVMKNAGWDTRRYPFDVYLPNDPGTSLVEIVTPKRMPLNQMEYILEADRFSRHPDLHKGWNAFSGSGDVSGEVVYANYGTKEDFEKLAELGIDLSGKIVIARYGGNFRGYKAKFAEASGAAGLLIYTDPANSGYTKGLVFPQGPYYNESAIQRGSLLTENFTGDPLTPFEPALPLDGKVMVDRLDPEETQLHKIPVTPIPYASAAEILGQMQGMPVPAAWQGGLPFTYRLEGGAKLRVRVRVEQPIDFARINNIVGKLEGSTYPDEWIILGCHYDAWAFGATDPNSGTAMLLTLSQALGKLAREGKRPERSILIAHWDGEEHGVIGSTEWVEQMKHELGAKAVAYLNFDAGVSGKNIGGAAAPSLKKTMMEAAKKVDYPYADKSIYDHWAGDKPSPSIGNLGGGSDHIAFYMHVGVPSLSGGAGGPTLYHTNYDDFYFYENFVDPEFQMGGAVAQWAGIMALRLANATLIPYQIPRYAEDLESHLSNATSQIRQYDAGFDGFTATANAIADLKEVSLHTEKRMVNALEKKSLGPKQVSRINKELLGLEKSFLLEEGMPFGSWYRSLYASNDPNSGYASWILPGIQYEIANQSADGLEQWDQRYETAIRDLIDAINEIAGSLPPI
ncbi:N-acetylated-alpha-linked acidic dipeptidase [Cyclobacterium lianum]|uniref:N-acetylated-alpha-linked acidic dipeptidase n=1 Tax=Cyclobacterium lianum TaxID=388280 RepID=A0A1M7L2A0_9BACT|nr:M28 family peptidase [Cyclobacterium lianum]SHM71935.1 N-acetylated-alpha-linked acidic dipeptidase [Cyclobacterium lianum]